VRGKAAQYQAGQIALTCHLNIKRKLPHQIREHLARIFLGFRG
jgi:hypothetical protein